MPGLDSYLVTLGVKGQDVVLSTMDKIRKKGEGLTKKKTAVNLVPSTKGGKGAGIGAPAGGATPAQPTQPGAGSEEKKNNKTQSEAVKKFGDSVKNFSSSAASLDPTSVMQSLNSAVGTALSGISVFGIGLGRLPEGIAAIGNNVLSMAKNAMEMAKQSTMAYHQLADRNAMTSYYGSRVSSDAGMSGNELNALVMSISGSMGKIQKPLADEINKLIRGKDTGALSRVAAGDWESTGTDQGWLLQQMSNGLQGLPPSIKQQFQASMLRQFSGNIQDKTSDQANVQKNAATLAKIDEKQSERLYRGTLTGSGAIDPKLTGMMETMNTMQVGLYTAGVGMAKAFETVTQTVLKLPDAMEELQRSFKEMAKDPSVSTIKRGMNNTLNVWGQ